MKKSLLAVLVLIAAVVIPLFAARSYNGTNQGGALGGAIASGATSLSIAFWLWQNSFTTGTVSDTCVICTANYSTTAGGLSITVNTSFHCLGTSDINFGEIIISNTSGRYRAFTPPSAGAWHHYVFVMTNDGSDYRAYIDGVKVTSFTNCDFNSPGTVNFASSPNPCVMSNGCTGSKFNAGKIAQIAFWQNVKLTDNEAASLASCTEPWLIHPEALNEYVPLAGVDSPEPNYSTANHSPYILGGTPTFTPGPEVCSGVDQF